MNSCAPEEPAISRTAVRSLPSQGDASPAARPMPQTAATAIATAAGLRRSRSNPHMIMAADFGAKLFPRHLIHLEHPRGWAASGTLNKKSHIVISRFDDPRGSELWHEVCL